MKHAALITSNARIRETFERLTAVTQVPLVVGTNSKDADVGNAFRVFVGDDFEGECATEAQVVVVSVGVGRRTWEVAASLGAIHVAVLPESEEWLLGHLVYQPLTLGRVIGFIPVVGGAGASHFASATATSLNALGHITSIVDADPCGGGIDILFGLEQEAGARWSQVGVSPSAGFAESLLQALPQISGLTVLSTPDASIREEHLTEVVSSMREFVDYVVVDFPRCTPESLEFAVTLCDDIFLVATTTVRSCAVLTYLNQHGTLTKAGLAVRQVPGTGLEPHQVADAAQLGIRAILPHDVRLIEHVEQGLGFDMVRLTPYAKAVHSFVAHVTQTHSLADAA